MKSVPAAPFRSRRRRYPTRTCASSGSISRFFLTNYYPSPAAIFEWNHRGSPHRTSVTSFCLPPRDISSVCFSSLWLWIFNSQIKFLWTWIEKWRLNIEICFVFKYYNEYFGHFACHFVGLYICCICPLIIIICYYWLTSLIIYGNIEYSSNFGVFKKIIGIFFYF